MKHLYLFLSITAFLTSCGFVEETNFIPKNYGQTLLINWPFTSANNYTYGSNIEVSGNSAKLVSNFFDTAWGYRQIVNVDNTGNVSTLTDYQIKVVIDASNTDFWNNIENNGKSVRFTDEDGITQLNFWTEKFDYSHQSAVFWVKVPNISASSSKNIYLYYDNVVANAASDGVATFTFFDDFEDNDTTDWTKYSNGDVSRPPKADPLPPTGSNSSYSIEKINNSDPHGGFKLIGTSIGLGFIFEGRIYRPSVYGGGAADRLAVEDSGFNGYGLQVNHSNSVLIERRAAGSATTISSSITYDPPEDSWYKYSFYMKTGGTFSLDLYDTDDILLTSVTDGNDANYNSFDRVTIHGGYEFYLDDMRIRKYTSPEPTITVNNQESTYPSNYPSIITKQGQLYTDLFSFSQTLGTNNEGTVEYQISNNGTDWYYWNGTNWISASGSSQINTAKEVNDNIAQFVTDVGAGTFYFKAFLISDGSQKVELDEVQLGYR